MMTKPPNVQTERREGASQVRGLHALAVAASVIAIALAIGAIGISGIGEDTAVTSRAIKATETSSAPRRMTIDVTADDYRWHVTYAGADGILGTTDDTHDVRDIHVPAHTTTELRLHSRDFVYKLRLPHADAAELAVPGEEFVLRFDSGAPSRHEIRGDQFCGFSHPELIGTLHVETDDEYDRWLAQASTTKHTDTPSTR